jgi:ribosome-binding protein aMBF1 (putative translation factor)
VGDAAVLERLLGLVDGLADNVRDDGIRPGRRRGAVAPDDQAHLRGAPARLRLLVADAPVRAHDDAEGAAADLLVGEAGVVEMLLRHVEPLAADIRDRLRVCVAAATCQRGGEGYEGKPLDIHSKDAIIANVRYQIRTAARVDTYSEMAMIAKMRYRGESLSEAAIEALRRKIAGADNGWFFAQIADRVAERRSELGLSQQDLARLVGTTQSAIARLERGGRPPRIDTLLKIAEALDTELAVELRPRRPLKEE